MLTKEALVVHFYDLFKKYGFKSITLDDLAREFGISKKTIYKHFDSKEAIVHGVIQHFLDDLRRKLLESLNEHDTSVTALMKCYQVVIDVFNDLEPQFINTLRKYYPGTHIQLIEFRDNTFFNCVKQIMERGIKEGDFRQDLPYENAIYFHFNLLHAFLFDKRPNLQVPELDASIVLQLLINDVRGMTSSKGYELLQGYEKIKNQA